MSVSSLVQGIVFGAIGVGYCMYGRSQREALWLVTGVALCLCPYVVAGWGGWAAGSALVGFPFLLRRYL